ncbi:MAG: S-layer homology domain-containing protein, partial [Burkholderiaceae bacterium]
IKRMQALGITGGCTATTYCPTQAVSREAMAAFLVRAIEGEPLPTLCAGGSPFTDVSQTSPFCPHIKRLQALNVTQGCTASTFCPGVIVQRDQMAVFLGRAFLGTP